MKRISVPYQRRFYELSLGTYYNSFEETDMQHITAIYLCAKENEIQLPKLIEEMREN